MGNKARKVIQVDKAGKDLRESSSAKEAALYCGYPNGSSAISKAIRHGFCAFSFKKAYSKMNQSKIPNSMKDFIKGYFSGLN